LKWAPAVISAAILLPGCAGHAPTVTAARQQAEFKQREAELSGWESWGFTGRLSVDDGQDGGSGRLDWRAGASGSLLSFRGALGQGAWQLELGHEGATLRLSDGSVATEPSVQALLDREVGWRIPVDALRWWVMGLSAPKPATRPRLELLGDGRLASLEQLGWRVEYQKYQTVESVPMPTRLEASNGAYRVKLAISRWWHSGDHDGA